MFDITLENAQNFKKCMNTLNTLIDEGKFKIDEQGVKLKAMDPSQIAMVSFQLPKQAFEEFEVEEDEIQLNLNDLNDRTKRARSSDSLNLKLDESGSRLKINFQGKIEREFDLPLLNLSEEGVNEPSVKFDNELKINGSTLKEILKDADLVASHVTLKATPEGLQIKAEGDKGNLETSINKEEDIILDYNVEEEQKAIFPIEYLKDLLAGATSKSIVTINLKTNNPLKMKYGIGEATLTYYLAPRVEE